MLKMLFETGHPWITFKDPCNVRCPQDHVGVIHSSNLCTEITLNTSDDETAVCNLGSVILDTHLTPDGSLDHEKLRETIRIAVRALDNVIDINFYPTEAAQDRQQRHRPIGLGVMGLQNALYQARPRLRLATKPSSSTTSSWRPSPTTPTRPPATSPPSAAPTRATRAPSGTAACSRRTPLDLLEQERGVPDRSPARRQDGLDSAAREDRQAGHAQLNVLAIAPTATISNIMGTTPCIEPTYKNLFVKSQPLAATSSSSIPSS